MGKAGKSRRAEKRKLEKQNAKAARKALYASFAGKGNSKRKGRQNSKGGPKFVTTSHPNGVCGNIGCKAPACTAMRWSTWRAKKARRLAERGKIRAEFLELMDAFEDVEETIFGADTSNMAVNT